MLLVAAFLAFAQSAQPNLPDLLSRVAEEAEILQQNSPKALSQETLEQRALMPVTRFRPRIGKAAAASAPPPPRLVIRQIVSEYSVGRLKDSDAGNLIEFRQVVSVDGKRVQSAASARHALSLGITSTDDRLRKRMLEDFAHHGLVDIATDYGIFLLAFNKRGLQKMKLALAGEEQVGVDPVWTIAWQQTSSDSGMLEFLGNEASRRALQGRLLVRKSDGLPLRIQSWTEHPQEGHMIRDEGTVDYQPSPHGFLTPASVIHRHLVDGKVITENLYRYEPFKLFSADAEIKFTELDTPPPSAPAKK
jgi:hypothetical protein